MEGESTARFVPEILHKKFVFEIFPSHLNMRFAVKIFSRMNVRILSDFVSFCAVGAVVYSILFTAATKSGEELGLILDSRMDE
jgi:hypothetical protein